MYKPILFSSEMVQAILEGCKTQTRRVIKPQPIEIIGGGIFNWPPITNTVGSLKEEQLIKYCPYGQVGDRLWVRETFMTGWGIGGCENGNLDKPVNIIFKANDGINERSAIGWKPSIFMPRWASRITLEITDIKVQRLWEITEKDCVAEGLKLLQGGIVSEYAVLWDKINGKKYPWRDDPWVWVISFKRVNQ